MKTSQNRRRTMRNPPAPYSQVAPLCLRAAPLCLKAAPACLRAAPACCSGVPQGSRQVSWALPGLWERRGRWAGETAPGSLIRLSAGLEPVADLLADLGQALGRATA